MARTVWTELTKTAPSNEQHVWIRVQHIPIAPFAAVWYPDYQIFITDITGAFYPPWTVTMWRPY